MANSFARALRKQMTPYETRLWAHLRPLRTKGFHFRRQVPMGAYIVDFACFSHRLVIEVDGKQHGDAFHKQADMERDAVLAKMGFRVLRFWNGELTRDFEGVMETILAVLEGRK